MADLFGRKLGLRSIGINPATWGKMFKETEPAVESITHRTADIISVLESFSTFDRQVAPRVIRNRDPRLAATPSLLLSSPASATSARCASVGRGAPRRCFFSASLSSSAAPCCIPSTARMRCRRRRRRFSGHCSACSTPRGSWPCACTWYGCTLCCGSPRSKHQYQSRAPRQSWAFARRTRGCYAGARAGSKVGYGNERVE